MNARKSLLILMVAIFLVNLRTTEASNGVIIIVCDLLDNGLWGIIGEVYYCYSGDDANIDLVTSPNSEVTSITHTNGSVVKIVDQIDMLSLRNMRVNYIPNNIKTKLPSLKAIEFYNVRLLSISKDNIQQFGGSLEYAEFGSNQLTFLDSNLFENNLNLKYISFSGNPITQIDPRFFETLTDMGSIEYVDLRDLSCMDT